MNSVVIGDVLKKTIKERGYTQEEFALEVGIGLSSLKKYTSGKVSYSIELLDTFCTYLGCSYDYLLGKSLSPNREFQDIKKLTRLSDSALSKLYKYGEEYDNNLEYKRYVDTLSTLVHSEFLLEKISDFLVIDKNSNHLSISDNVPPQNFISIGETNLSIPDIEEAYMLSIIKALTKAKENYKTNLQLNKDLL